MPILISPLQLEGYYVQEFHFAARQAPEGPSPLFFQFGLHPQLGELFDPGDLTINTQIGGGVNQEDPNRIVSVVRIESRTEAEVKSPYDFLVVMVGHFILNAQPPAEERANAMEALRTTAASVLYSAARELIASVTGRGPFPAAILPTVVIALDPITEQEQPTATKKGSRKGTAKKVARKKGGKKQQR
jgi:preprotein translocase subunit SecB